MLSRQSEIDIGTYSREAMVVLSFFEVFSELAFKEIIEKQETNIERLRIAIRGISTATLSI